VTLVGVLPVLLLAVQQQSPSQAPSAMPASPVKRIEVLPATRTVTAGDSIRIELRALDANGKPVPCAVLYAKLLGGDGEGGLDPASGWLVAS